MPAISAFDRPEPTRASTSRSRGLSTSTCSLAAAARDIRATGAGAEFGDHPVGDLRRQVRGPVGNQALDDGASGFLLQSGDPRELIAGLKAATQRDRRRRTAKS